METSTNPSWEDLRVLLAIHRSGSFLAAGKVLRVSTSTVARRLDALEDAVGRALVHRSHAGATVESDALSLVELAERIDLGLRSLQREPSVAEGFGTVRVSMGEGFVRPVTAVLAELRHSHPGLELELISETKFVDLGRREADIALRKGRSASPALVERLTGHLTFAFYAAPAYLERRLRVARLRERDLADQDFVGYDGALALTGPAHWLRERGARRFVVRSNSDAAVQEAAERGQGIALLAEALGRTTPGLVRIESDLTPPDVPVYLVYHKELRKVPRVRLVANALHAALRRGLARTP